MRCRAAAAARPLRTPRAVSMTASDIAIGRDHRWPPLDVDDAKVLRERRSQAERHARGLTGNRREEFGLEPPVPVLHRDRREEGSRQESSAATRTCRRPRCRPFGSGSRSEPDSSKAAGEGGKAMTAPSVAARPSAPRTVPVTLFICVDIRRTMPGHGFIARTPRAACR